VTKPPNKYINNYSLKFQALQWHSSNIRKFAAVCCKSAI